MTDVVDETRATVPVKRVFTEPGVHPYSQVTWKRQDVVMTNWRDGTENFRQEGVEFPDFWSPNAVQIVTSKYFRGKLGTETREWSLRQLIDRVVWRYVSAARDHGYVTTVDDLEIFEHELTHMLLHQVFSFNSPVWFNVGTDAPQQVSACFLLSVDDTMESILNWYREEGLIFKGGSGAGTNLSKIRSSREHLSSGGNASGPVSFMRGADASAGTIKSGGATRRAAKMVVLNVDHPDVVEFVATKVEEEKKIRALRDAGFDVDLGGRDIYSVQYQNANNSVRLSDEFMRAVENGDRFGLRARTTGEVVDTVDAAELFRQICDAAWQCADPGVQYDDTINRWHTCPESGRITTSNPCSEYVHLDNSSCNLASINLLKFVERSSNDRDAHLPGLDAEWYFDVDTFAQVVRLVTLAMDVSICFADFPTEKIAETTRAYRQLGLGYANLGALLMSLGLAYDSPGGRSLAGAITSLMTAESYRQSAIIASVVGPYDGFERNADAHRRVIAQHGRAGLDAERVTDLDSNVWRRAVFTWRDCTELGRRHGYRNAQATLLAPTGTIGLAMDVDTTGIEPALGLVITKKLVGGGSMKITARIVVDALRALGYPDEQVESIVAYVNENGHVIDAPGLRSEHYAVFDCALGRRSISPMGHVRMMAAVQPFLSGAISKTVNMPTESTVDHVAQIYAEGWRLGLKAVAVYRDGCKVGQPASSFKKDEAAPGHSQVASVPTPRRQRLPRRREGVTTSFDVGGAEGYMTANSHPDNGLGEVFLKMSKQGSTLAGIVDAFSIAVSIGLQSGVPLETYVRKYANMRFEPSGLTNDPEIRFAHSVVDYIFRRLALDYLDEDARHALGILGVSEREAETNADVDAGRDVRSNATQSYSFTEMMDKHEEVLGVATDAPLCVTCGVKMRRAGSCYVCEGCGSTSGCS